MYIESTCCTIGYAMMVSASAARWVSRRPAHDVSNWDGDALSTHLTQEISQRCARTCVEQVQLAMLDGGSMHRLLQPNVHEPLL